MNDRDSIWAILGLDPTNDEAAIKRAYRAKLRTTNPEDDAAAFQRLRQAFERAQQQARWQEALAAEDIVSTPAELPAREEPAHDLQSPPRRSADARTGALEDSLAGLWRELQRDAPLEQTRAQELLDELLNSTHLERFDLLEMLDDRLADVLERSGPRSDPLLPQVVAALQWSERRGLDSLPPAAHRLLSHYSYQSRLRQLETGTDEQCQAWRRLAGPEHAGERWLRAFVQHHTSWPELDLLDSLEREHPELLDRLNEANVAWWRRFSQRPRFSALTFSLGLMASMVAAFWVSADASRSGDRTAWMLMALLFAGCFLALELVRVYLIEWPILLVRQRWQDVPPPWLRSGWVADGMLLPALALWSRDIAWLAWTWAGLAVVTALWAAVAGGPTGPVALRDRGGVAPKNSRLLRLLARNVFPGTWAALLVHDYSSEFELPVILAVAAGLCASALGRDEQAVGFNAGLSLARQRAAGWAVIALTLVMMGIVVRYGDVAEWQPAILVGTLACIVARYCFQSALSVAEGTAFVILQWFTMSALLLARALAGDHPSLGALLTGTWYVWALALLIQAGTLVAVLRFLWQYRGRNGQRHPA